MVETAFVDTALTRSGIAFFDTALTRGGIAFVDTALTRGGTAFVDTALTRGGNQTLCLTVGLCRHRALARGGKPHLQPRRLLSDNRRTRV